MARRNTNRPYQRTARLNELLREIVADNVRQIDDERLELVSVTGVESDPEARRAVVFFDTPDVDGEGDEIILEAFEDIRPRLQSAINRESRLRNTPVLDFRPDMALRSGERIDAILRSIEPAGGGEEGDAPDGADAPVDGDDVDDVEGMAPDPGA